MFTVLCLLSTVFVITVLPLGFMEQREGFSGGLLVFNVIFIAHHNEVKLFGLSRTSTEASVKSHGCLTFYSNVLHAFAQLSLAPRPATDSVQLEARAPCHQNGC